MCELLSMGLAVALLVVALFLIGAKYENSCLQKDIKRFKTQIKNYQEEQLKKAIEEKVSAWRRDRRYGDNKHGGYFVNEDGDMGQE